MIREERNKRNHLALLLLADEQEDMIERYLDCGTMYVLEEDGMVKAECVVTDEGDGVLEIKNIAVHPACLRKGFGRRMIDFISGRYGGAYRILQLGTGDSPLTIPFYEACGFTRSGVIKDFFIENYDHPIIEDGVQLTDMVILQKQI